MLRVVEIIEPTVDPTISSDEYQPVNFDWKHEGPVSFWSIKDGRYYMMVGYEHRTGRIISVETPSYGEVAQREGPCWNLKSAEVGHPRIAVDGPQWKVLQDLDVKSFKLGYSRDDVKIHWGTDSKCLRSGRCMFGLDDDAILVSVGYVDLSLSEFEVMHRGLARDRG